MDKLKMHTAELTQDRLAALRELFPGCVTEARDEQGEIRLRVDFDQLRQELSDTLVEGPQERYQLNWPGKREAVLAANAPVAGTLRPCTEQSVDFANTGNIFIEGDNLDALKLLQQSYAGRLRLIYIDPPYNTGSDLVYADDFAEDMATFLRRSKQVDAQGNRLSATTETDGRFHSDWLSMMYSRLRLARHLLRDDGVIMVHIDENEYPNLEKLLAEIFGENNNLGTIIWDKRNPKGDARGVAQQHEMICLYCRNRQAFSSDFSLRRPKENAAKMLARAAQILAREKGPTDAARRQYRDWLRQQDFSAGEKAYSRIDEQGHVFRTVSMAWPGRKPAPAEYFTPLTHPVTGKSCPVPARGWRNPPSTMQQLLRSGHIVFGADERTQPTRKYLLRENMFENVPSLLYYGGSDSALLAELDIPFDTPKPVQLAKRLIQSVCREDDLMLDFFAGSCTAAHALMQLNAEDGGRRRFIMVQIAEACAERSEAARRGYTRVSDIGKQRLRRAADRIRSEVSEQMGESDSEPDLGFRVFRVDTSDTTDAHDAEDALAKADSSRFIDTFERDSSALDVLFRLILAFGMDLSSSIEEQTIDGQAVFFVDGTALVACLSTGQRYREALVRTLAARQPERLVFRDDGFEDSSLRLKAEKIFHSQCPHTDVKCI